MITVVCDIEYGKEVCRLTGGGQHSSRAALQLADLCGYRVTGRILQTGIEISCRFQIEKFAHFRAGFIFEGRALHDRNLTGFAVTGAVAALYAFGFNFVIVHIYNRSFLSFQEVLCGLQSKFDSARRKPQNFLSEKRSVFQTSYILFLYKTIILSLSF